MATELDLTRLARLQALLESELPEIVTTILHELSTAIDEIERSISTGDLPAAALAAHSARNSALMIDAKPILAALNTLEAGARAAEAEAVRVGLEQLRLSWPALRARLEQLLRAGV